MAKVKIVYPQIVINQIEIEIPNHELDRDLCFDEKFNLITKYGKDIPSYDEPDYNLCKGASEWDGFKFIVKN